MSRNFIKCGITGWCLEILFTGITSLKEPGRKLVGQSSIIMFPIYGLAAFLGPIASLMKKQRIWIRGGVYTLLIFSTEYATGRFLKKHKLCPWDYSSCKRNIHGLIRLDFAPLWFGTGLLFERLIAKR